MSTAALNNLWTYIKGLSLSYSDRQWLAEHLVEPEELERAKERKKDDVRDLSRRVARVRRRAENSPSDAQLEALFSDKPMPNMPEDASWKCIIDANTGKTIKPIEKWL